MNTAKSLLLCLVAQILVAATALANNITLNYVPPASNVDQQGFIRITNGTSVQASVTILPIDDAGNIKTALNIVLDANETKTFNSSDIESGNPSKGLSVGAGRGVGNWRLAISSVSQISAMGLVRSPSGFLNSIHDIAPSYLSATLHEIGMFNPAKNVNQQSKLRLSDNSGAANTFIITGVDDSGRNAGNLSITVPAFATATLTSSDLEQGNVGLGLVGALGAGTGKWRLVISSTQSSSVLGLMELPGGYISDISSLANLPADSATNSNNGIACADVDGASVFSQQDSPVYLGFMGSSFALNSINNTFGSFGSQFGSSSIRNQFSIYGSQFGQYSATNSFSLSPPVLVKNGKVLAFLSTNASLVGMAVVSLADIDSSCSLSAASPSKPFVP